MTAARPRLLFVSYCFAPILTPEAIQNGRTLRALDELGWDITVLTATENTVQGRRDPALERQLPLGLRVVRAPSFERPFLAFRGAPIKLLLHLGVPEQQVFWYPAALRAGMALLQQERFDAMHSWSSFQTSNLVGLALRMASGIPWVVHLSDPWIDSPYFAKRPLQRMVVQRLEHAIFSNADAIVFITAETRDLVMRKYPKEWRDRTHAIPHGYLREDVVRDRARGGGRELRLVHAGSFYLGMREPYALFEALAEVARDAPLEGRLRLVMVGPTLPRYVTAGERAGLARVLEWRGPTGFDDSQAEVVAADGVIVIDADADVNVFLPSKIADYLAARRPILGLTPERGATADLLRRLGCPVVQPSDVSAIAAAIRTWMREHATGGIALPSAYERVAEEHEIRVLTRGLDEALRLAIDRQGRRDRRM